MTPPRLVWEMNVNAVISVLGFLIVIGGGAMAYASFQAESLARHAEADRRIVALELQARTNAEGIRAMQIANATSTSETQSLRREMGVLQADVRELIRLIQTERDGQ